MIFHNRTVTDDDFVRMSDLLLKDGVNEWNYVTKESIKYQFKLIKEKKALVIMAEDALILGFAVLILKNNCPEKLKKYTDLSTIAYIKDVVVSSDSSGKGIGSKLLQECLKQAHHENCHQVFIERHEENLASGGMMKKAGFQVVETFLDLDKRSSGSRKTTVLVANT